MRGLGGFVLLAGIGVGLFVYFPAPVDRDTTLEQAKRATFERVAARGETAIAPVAATAPPSVARFSPALTLSPARSNAQFAAAAPTATTPTAKVESVANWQTSVAPAPAGTALEPTDPESRYKLVVDIQQQLKRVGCYWGRANGAWNNSTREALRTFTSNTNAALPVDKPDYLLLSLLKQNSGRSCGIAETTTVATHPQNADTVAAAQPEVLPWKANQANSLYKPMPNSVVSSEPLPGRMTIGGPKEFPAAQQAPLVPGTPGQPGVATAALDPGVASPSAAPQKRQAKKSGGWRKPAHGTPRYNLMLSLGGVY
ncbi:hypothetical protein GIW81_17980 [Hyphomicrobium sp. xq]|uniref:Peptidoglycan binding domain-containing protein n=1 Tax=Hyphomicrobium album TaxID=2665159 RepID=A0A6I3KQX2_9HYPH|nr:peptidoglycan-binding domain-containing protein [Hyphomicrobium album]MTD96232.1 hypothetical protein [Hyphomicrobium album]